MSFLFINNRLVICSREFHTKVESVMAKDVVVLLKMMFLSLEP